MARVPSPPPRPSFNKKAEEPLHITQEKFFNAIGANDIEKVKQTLEKFPQSVSWVNEDGLTGLMRAAQAGNTEIAKILLDAHAVTDAINKNNSTALMFASYEGHGDIVELLLSRGANINHANINQSTALMSAAWNGHLDIVKLLVKAHADITLKDSAEKTALDHAKEENHPDIAAFLEAEAAKPVVEEKPAPASKLPVTGNEEGIKSMAEKMKKAGLTK